MLEGKTIIYSEKEISEVGFSFVDRIQGYYVKEIKIQKEVEEIIDDVLDASELYTTEQYTVDAENKKFSSIDGVLFSADGTILYKYPAGRKESDYIVPEGVKAIGRLAFAHANVENVVLPDTIQTIEVAAFSNSKIRKINIPKYVSSIKHSVFLECENLKNVTWDTTLCTEVPERTFYYCMKLTNIKLPASIVKLKEDAFSHCTSLRNINLSNIKEIGRFALYDCPLINVDIDGSCAVSPTAF